jgi:hypothetical protein
MTLNAALDHLWQTVHQLREDTQALRLHAVEDRPTGEPSKLVEDVGAAAVTLAGWVEELVAEAAGAATAPRYLAGLGRLRQDLDRCGACLERVTAHWLEDMARTSRLDELAVFGRRSGAESRAWVEAIEHAVDRAHLSLWAVQAALTNCWRELAERAWIGEPPPTPLGSERSS